MAKQPNAKVIISADTSDFHSKMKGAKTAVKDFEQSTDKALESVGEAFGVNTQQVEKLVSSVRGLGLKMQESGNAGAKAFGSLLANTSALSAGIAGLGIGAAVAGFKVLRDEAENFKQTVAGANIELATTAYIDTYRQVIHDFNRDLGEGFAKTESGFKKLISTFGANMKAYFSSGGFAASMPGDFNNEGIENYYSLLSAATDKAKTAEDIYNNIFNVQRQISDSSVEWARMEREIAEYKRIAYDKTNDTRTQQEALAKAAELINKRYGDEAELRKQLADLQFEYNNLAESSIADIDKANQLRIQEEATVARMNNALRELSERQATIAANVQKEAEERKKALAYAQAIAASRQDLAEWGSLSQPSEISAPGVEAMSMPGIAVKVTPQLDTAAAADISRELEMMMISSFETTGQLVGQLIGDLATGGDAWKNFSNSAISAFGDMAISVGKMAIQTGTATLGIKAALESLNGYVAIAAGVALVALGTAVKSGLSNIAGGNYNATSNVASAAGNYGGKSNIGTGFETREINVKVSGKVVASGNQLLVILENEQKRRNHTT